MTTVYVRKRKGANGKMHLYLDYYPPVFNPITRVSRRHESLGMFVYEDPKNQMEKNYNDETMKLAEAVRCKRSIAVMNNDLGFIEESFADKDFLEFFEYVSRHKDKSWTFSRAYFSKFMNGKCRFKDLTIQLAEDYKMWLINGLYVDPKSEDKRKRKPLNNNTISKYYTIFRAVLRLAYRGKCIRENINEHLENIPLKKTRREFLTVEEIIKLSRTECMYDVLKQASMFSILTGLRISDIRTLEWKHICEAPDGKPCIRKRIEKTDTEETIFISEQALAYCGERKESGLIFKGLRPGIIDYAVKRWVEAAGIQKKISFHCFRHTYATLLVTQGVDIYTVSRQMTHTNVKTTQVYLHMVDRKGRIAAENTVIDNLI